MKAINLTNWMVETNRNNELAICGHSSIELAHEYGTPLHILNEEALLTTAKHVSETVSSTYPGKASIHYAMKCNSLPTVLHLVKQAGLQAEVMTEYELWQALQLGFKGSEIIVNGPCKTESFLKSCISASVRFIIVDSMSELKDIHTLAQTHGTKVNILLRINPNYTPKGMNSGSATGSRKGCAFGFDLEEGEVAQVMEQLPKYHSLSFQGFHLHIGTGIRYHQDYTNALECLSSLKYIATATGHKIQVIDVGGGFASPMTREFTAQEMLLYQGIGKLPKFKEDSTSRNFSGYIQAITASITHHFQKDILPELIIEPGRSITSHAQCLLLTVHRKKTRKGVGTWLITDGGVSTVTLPTFYEYHEILLCNNLSRTPNTKVNIIGPACFAGDIVYKNKLMPEVNEGEIIAVMDSGAYFLQLESSFGFQRSAVVAVNSKSHRLIRTRETFAEMISRDSIRFPQISYNSERM